MLAKLLRTVWDRLGAPEAPAGIPRHSRVQTPYRGLDASGPLDDRLLLELANEPERPLLPQVRDQVSILPLILVLAAVAPLLALPSYVFTDNDVMWGCRSLEGVAAERVGEFLDPATRDRDVPFPWQPPLTSWLTSFVLQIGGCDRIASLFVIPWLSVAALIVAIALFARQLGGTRVSLAATLLAACHPQLLQATPRAAAGNAGLALVLLTLWGFAKHWNEYPGQLSWPLAVAGFCGGLCLLAGGPLALALAAVIGLYVAWRSLGRRVSPSQGQVRGVVWGRRSVYSSVGILAGIAAFCGGWWLALMLFRYGLLFAVNWLTWRSGSTGDGATLTQASSTWWENLTALGVPLFGTLSLLGAFRIMADHHNRLDEAGWRHRRLLLTWGAVAFAVWVFGGVAIHGTLDGEQAWRGFVLAPLLLLAAVGLTEIADRRVPFELALPLLLAAVVWSIESGDWGTIGTALNSSLLPQLLRFIVAVLLAAAGFLAFHAVRGSRSREAQMLTALLVAVLFVHLGSGWQSLPAATSQRETGLREAHQSLRTLGKVRHVTLVSQEARSGGKPPAPPPLLTYLVKSHWPRATVATAVSWEQALTNAPASAEDPEEDESPAALPSDRNPALHVVIVWGPRGRVNLPPLLGPARRHGQVLNLSQLDAALFVVPPPALPPR